MAIEPTPKWAAVTNAALVGWNVGVTVAFLTAIAVGIVTTHTIDPMRETVAIPLILASAAAVGMIVGFVSGRKVRGWFAVQTRSRNFVWLAGLLAVTLVYAPAPFRFGVG